MASDLSLVLPVFNEETRLPNALRRLEDFAQANQIQLQLVAVDDGSTDGSADVLSSYEPQTRFVSFRSVRIEHRGKGAAVRSGVRLTSAEITGYCDVDLSAGPDAILKLYREIEGGADAAVSSRGLEESILEVRQPPYRELAGRFFNVMVRRLTGIGIRDTQCGLKLFRRPVADELFRHQRLDGFAFDSELVVLAVRLGYDVREVPIRWAHEPNSKVSMVKDSFRMARDLFRIVRRMRSGALHAPGVPAKTAMDQMTRSEETHWWYIAKRRLIRQVLADRRVDRLVDVGCGGGALLRELEASTDTVGVDLSPDALHYASRHGAPRLVGANADSLPFADGVFDVALALDVIEHYERPEHMLREVARVLRPGGLLIVTVPAFQWMWSYADHVLGHYRRYVRADLARDLVAGGYEIERVTYFHSWLLPIAWLFRKLRAVLRKTESADDFAVPSLLNRMLMRLTDWERKILADRDLRFGLSLLAVASTGESQPLEQPASERSAAV